MEVMCSSELTGALELHVNSEDRTLHGHVKFGVEIIINIPVLYVRSIACKSTVVNMSVMRNFVIISNKFNVYRVYKTLVLHVILNGCETWSHIKEEVYYRCLKIRR
jgi:hypothetical protein